MALHDPATEGLPQISAQQAPQVINLLLKLLSGAGLKNLSKSGGDLQAQGIDPRQFLMDPLIRAGAGVEALGISPELILSMLKQPGGGQQQGQQQPQRGLQDIIASVSAQNQGDSGLVPQQLPQQGPPPGAGPPGAPPGLAPGGGIPLPPRFPG